jgi:predicted amidophosphoribosyltransferase
LLPPIPEKLLKIDDVTAGEHFSLDATDTCFYIWEYAARQGYTAGPTNQLIKNLKIKPSEIAKTPARQYYKQQAINHAAKAVRNLLGQQSAEGQYSFVPVPSSKAIGDTDHDDRIVQVLERAFSGWKSDVRQILRVRRSMQADHESTDRMTYDELLAFTEVLQLTKPLRTTIVILDDVLNSGKHFKVAKSLLSIANPTATILGLFLARCTRERDSGFPPL